jgi:hypothetical protein
MRAFVLPVLLALILSFQTASAQELRFEEVVGHDFGERITLHHQAMEYLRQVADASDRVTIERIGDSWQGRPIWMAIVTSPSNHARLGQIKQNAQRLGDPRGASDGEIGSIIDNQPAIVWLGGSIHGFELSGTEGLLMLLEHLVTRDDAETQNILNNTVILIDPILNPDGRDAFAAHNHDGLGATVSANPDDWTNDFTSFQALRFRTSHYFFDINRDWFAHTHRETQARVPIMRDWRPQVGVDAHEMGSDVEFYVDPPADPIAPFFPEYTTRWFERFGEAHARAFDAAGVDYMMGERFNYFYPAYTTSYLSYQGAVGMLYEQGSSRGLALERPDGSIRTLRDASNQQYIAAVAAVNLAANERRALLQDYVQAHRDAIADGQSGTRRYVISAEGADPLLVEELARMLVRNGIEVYQLTGSADFSNVADRTGQRANRQAFPSGSLVVDASQPRNRLIRTLLEPEIEVPADFLAEARERVDRGENPRFYDITAWSLPLLFNMQAYRTNDTRSVSWERVDMDARPIAPAPRTASYAYLIDGSQGAGMAALYHLADRGHRVSVVTQPTRLEGRNYASGTGIVWVNYNEATVHEDVHEMHQRYNLRIDATSTGLAERGSPSLGSGDVFHIRKPEIAILAEDPIGGYSFGWARFVLDRQYEIPATVIRTQSLRSARLSRYDVIIVPDISDTTSFKRIAGDDGLERLARWVREGGTLVTIGDAADLARGPMSLTRLRSWYDDEDNRDAQRISTPGAFMRTDLDRRTWLTMGYDHGLAVLANSARLFLPPDGAPSPARRTHVRITEDNARIAGHLWDESADRLPGTVFAYEERAGRGRVISFIEDINFRGYWRGTDRLFLNAVIAGPSAP